MKQSITIEINADNLSTYSDEFLTTAWYVAQANPAPLEDRAAGELADAIGLEIIKRWLSNQPIPMHHHKASHYYWNLARMAGKWDEKGRWAPNTETTSEGKE